MSVEVFTDPWAEALGAELNDSETYRKAAADWHGALVLEMAGGDEVRSVYLDLEGGTCRSARLAGEEEREAAAVVLRADAETWQRVLAGEVAPLWGLMSGKLQLAKGSLGTLIPFADASKELVAAAGRIDCHFP